MEPTSAREAIFNDWRLVALSPLPVWVLALATLAVLAALYWAWRGVGTEPRAGRRRLLVALRAVAGVLALLLLLEPGIELLATTKIRGRVAVLVDKSRSMSLPSEPGGPSRADAVASVLENTTERAALEGRFQVEYFAFAENAAPSDPAALAGATTTAGTLDAAAAPAPTPARELERTQILPALEEAARAGAGRPLAGIVLLSDGADNGGLDEALRDGPRSERARAARERLEALGAPVFALDATGGELRDVAISAVRADDFAFVRNTVDIEVEIAQRGYPAMNVPVVLERDGQVITTGEATATESKPGTVRLSFVPDTTGEFAFTVRTPVQSGEAVTQNNTRSFVLKVIRDRVRVLHVAGRPSWDERFLRALLKRDPNVDLISFFILRTPSDLPVASNEELSLIPFPTDEIFRQQLDTFDLVIFHNFTYRPYRMAYYLPGIAEYVKNGGAFLMIGGDNSFSEGAYASSPIEEILPVQLSASPLRADAEPFKARLTPEGRRHPVSELGVGEVQTESKWSLLAPLHGINRATLRPDAQALAVHPTLVDESGRPAPVVAVRDVGRGRSMAITADSTWMWSFVGAREGRTQRLYDDFYHRAIRWLVRDPELTQVRLQAEREQYSPSEPVALLLRARSRDYGPAAGARVSLRVESAQTGEIVRQTEGVVGSDGTLRVEVGALPPGPFRAHAEVQTAEAETGRAEDAFVVEESGPELARPAPRPDLLRFVASATDGTYQSAAGARLSALPFKDPERVEIGQRKSRPLWDRAWTLVALCLVLGSEWFLRRRWGFY